MFNIKLSKLNRSKKWISPFFRNEVVTVNLFCSKNSINQLTRHGSFLTVSLF